VFIRILLTLIVLALVWWLITFLPIGEPFMTIIRVVIVLALIWEVLAIAGVVPSPSNRYWKEP
jgi:hypothetical protein